MTSIRSALTNADHRIQNLLGDHPTVSEIISYLAQWYQIEAILLLAEQMEKIANAIDSMASMAAGRYEPTDGVMPFEER